MMESLDLPPLPEGWVWTKIGEVLDVFSGYGFPKKYQGKLEGDIPFFKVGDISKTVLEGNMYLRTTENYISFAECEEIKAQPLKEGTIVFAKIGEAIKLNRRAIVGQLSLVDNNVMGVYNFSNGLNNLFIYYFFRTIKLGDYSRATTVPSVRKADIENIAFSLPPLPEQHRIVAKIEELFTKLEAGAKSLEKTKVQLKRYRQAVLKYAFEGNLTEEWRERHKDELEPASVLLERIKEERKSNVKGKYKELPPLDTSDLPELPEGWVWTRLGEFSRIILGQSPPSSTYNEKGEGLPFYQGKLEFGSIYPTPKKWCNAPNKIAEKGDVLISVRAPVGPTNVCPEKSCMGRGLSAIRGFGGIETFFILYLLRAFEKVIAGKGTGTTFKAVTGDQLRNFLIPLPPLSEQQIIVEEIERRFSVADDVEKTVDQSLKQAERLRQSILKQTFEGKLVLQDPSDEPASVLLERIKEDRENREIEAQSKTKTKRKRDLVQKQRRFNDYVE